MSSHWCQDCSCENGWWPSADMYVAWKTFKLKSCAFAIFIDFSNFLCLLFTLWTKKVKQPSNHWGEWLFAKMAEHVLNPFWWVSNASLTLGLWPDPKIIGLSRILRIHYSVLAWFQLSHLQCCWSTIFLKTSKFKMLLVIANFLIKIYFGKSLSKLIEKNKWVEVGIYFLLLQMRDYFNDSDQYG